MSRTFRIVGLIALLVLAGPGLAAGSFFEQSFGNLQEEAATARGEGKKAVLIMFEQDDCPWCQKMMATVLSKAPVQEYFRARFHPIQVNIKGDTALTDFMGRETTEKEFAFGQRVRATPVFAFFDLDGKLLTKYTGATKDPEEFLWLGEFVADGHYKGKTFTAYKREKMADRK